MARIRVHALVVLVLGCIYLLSPPAETQGATTTLRTAVASNMCGGFCGVCQTGFFCPDIFEQHSQCQAQCGQTYLSCDDCSDDVTGCAGGAWTAWWCG